MLPEILADTPFAAYSTSFGAASVTHACGDYYTHRSSDAYFTNPVAFQICVDYQNDDRALTRFSEREARVRERGRDSVWLAWSGHATDHHLAIVKGPWAYTVHVKQGDIEFSERLYDAFVDHLLAIQKALPSR